MEVVEDLYAILGVDENADDAEIKKAYKKLAIELHPDRFVGKPDEQQEAAERFSKVSHAHNVLKDKQQRADYNFDRRLRSGMTDSALEENEEEKVVPAIADDDPRRISAERKYNDGLAYFKTDLRMAVDSFKEAVRLAPDVSQYHTMLGVAYQKHGWPTYAVSELKTALKLAPRDPVATKWLRQVEAVIKEEEELKEKMEKKGKKGKKSKKDKPKSEKKVVENKFKKKKTSFWRTLLAPLLGPK
jgi:curved DNA-binding protein CbpA